MMKQPTKKATVGVGNSRQSGRLLVNDQYRVVDEATKKRRLQKHLDTLERDNVQDDPHANLTWNKAIPKFADELSDDKAKRKKHSDTQQANKLGEIGTKKGKKLRAELQKSRFRKNFIQLIEEEQKLKEEDPETMTYSEVRAPPSSLPARKFCSVCGLFSKYNCVKCGSKFCSLNCKGVHQDMRCLKWTA